jgi:hypothetical protein
MNHTTTLPTRRPLAALLALALASAAATANAGSNPTPQPLTPAFTYQGELRLGSGPANGAFDLQFRLFDSLGLQIGATITATNVAVSGGLFSVPLDFGPAQFAGERQFLEIAIRPAGSGTFETLSPRTEVTAAPYAWSAAVALANSVTTTSIVDGTVQSFDLAPGAVGTTQINASQVQRRVSGTCAAGQYVRIVNQDGTVTCGTDANSGGTVTSIATGAGLTGGPITTAGTIAVAPGGIGTTQINANEVQRRVTGTCAVGNYVRQVNQDGSVICEPDATGPAAWRLDGNAGTNPATNFIGTTDAQPFVVRTRNAQSLRIEPSTITFGTPALPITTNVIGGSHVNFVTAGARGATIAGGGVPGGDSDPDFANEGPNRVTDAYGTVGGGYNNQAGDNAGTALDRGFATVGGGVRNTASGGQSTIGGGESNQARAAHSVVGGGWFNDASNLGSTVSGGESNIASGTRSTVGGGDGNTASGARSTVSGGSVNLASGPSSAVGGGSNNVASEFWSTVGGGASNVASLGNATVGGGGGNTASGGHSTVAGGLANCAGGRVSWAGGNRAKARPGTASGAAGEGCAGVASSGDSDGDNGTFVWADSQAADLVSTGPNQYLVRAGGGIWLGTTSTVDIPAGRFINTSTGAHLTTGGTWTNASSRALKTGFADVDAADVLSRVLQLGISTWSYRASHEGRHMGPIAEDFHALFGLGGDDASISTVDASGVALAAIQGLNEKLEAERDALAARVEAVDAENAALRAGQARLDAENAALRDESTELRARLAAIEARLGLSAGGER